MKAFWDETQRAHAPKFFLQRGLVRPFLETPARADALLTGCRAAGLEVTVPGRADRPAILAIHAAQYLDFLRDGPAAWHALEERGEELVPNVHPSPEMLANAAREPASVVGRLGWYTADTSCPITHGTWPAAEAAAACAIAAADEVLAGRSAYALCRPPGHHAYPARAGGHCYLNNAAIAAERLRAGGAARVAVLDIDAHHGNGTQGIFWRRDEVVVVSIHGDPSEYYPFYVGHAGERGEGPGAGCNLNMPLPRGCSDEVWLRALAHGIAFVRRCGIDALVVSLGFDASISEPLRFLSVSDDGFARAGEAIGGLRLPAVLVQEGGYDPAGLARLLARFCEGFGTGSS